MGVTDPRDLPFQPVDLPHDWLIHNTLDLYENSIGWYRREWEFRGDADQVLLYFEGVYMDSTLYVNGQKVGEWKYGYSSFEHDLTPALQLGKNEILLKVVHQSPNSRWYSGAGIYRNVWLKKRGKNHIVTDGVYISTKRTDDGWQLLVDTELSLAEESQLTHTLIENGQVVAESAVQFSPQGTGQIVDTLVLKVEKPLLWSVDEPNLYQLKTELISLSGDGPTVVDMHLSNVGFRETSFDPKAGFFLNGRPLKLNGVCEHHDLGALGAAVNKDAIRRRLEILKEMGVNAIRTAHNMPAVELMDLADEMGFLIVSEAFDMWELPKTKYDYARFFLEWAERDIRSWVRRDRNHPSLIMWSIGNEIYDTHGGPRGVELTKMLRNYVLEHDPRQNGRVTMGSNYMPWEGAQKCADELKIVGYNYGDRYYHEHHARYPDWVIYGSETLASVQSRGIYHFPYEQKVLGSDDGQCSALGNSPTSWGAASTEACLIAHRDAPFTLGQFIWTGFDYLGEPTPYHTKNSYLGQIDTASFPKDPYYIFQSAWTHYKKAPMIHVFPYWDFNPGQLIDVRVCSNAPLIELQLNGRSLGTHRIDHAKGMELVGWWKVPFEPGELKAIAYDEEGNVIATSVRRSFGDPKRIRLQADRSIIRANGTDLIFVEISAEDGAGNPVENATNRVQVEVTGAGRLIGLDNGDSTDYDQYKGLSRRLFSGKLMAIIAAGLKSGDGEITVSSPGLLGSSLKFQVLPAEGEDLTGVSAVMQNGPRPIVLGSLDEIPLRKIELTAEGGQELGPERREVAVRAQLYPRDTSYRDVEWSVVTDLGAPTNIAKIEASGLEAKITALGDGSFRVRCTSKNGSDRVRLISDLEFSIHGLGTAYKDPYGFVTGGLYDYAKGSVTPGNERGVATDRDGETHVGYRDLDFGPYGSDEITIPIFALSDDPYTIQIWEGMPGEKGSELLNEVVYQKPSVWNVYQPETYRLSKRLRGITSLCFVLKDKVHIKGFSFAKQSRAFSQNRAVDCDFIYGDTFSKRAEVIEGIGNNVSIEFADMDFGSEGAGKLVIYGRAPIDNTIHILFSGEQGEKIQIIEFKKRSAYEAVEFELGRITGLQKVTFIFLPGSNFDFGWFRFKT